MLDEFYAVWTTTFNNLLRRVVGSKYVFGSNDKIDELTDLNNLAINKVKGLFFLFFFMR